MSAGTKIEPTEYTIRVKNPNETYKVPLPVGVGELEPGESLEINVSASKLSQYTSNRQYETVITGDNSAQLAAAAKDRDRRANDARDRLDALKQTFEGRLKEEREIGERLKALEREEREAEDRDQAALIEAGRSEEVSATGVLLEAGAKTDEITGLTFDLWGARIRCREAKAAYMDAVAVVADADAGARAAEIPASEKAEAEAAANTRRIREEVAKLEGQAGQASRDAAEARRRAVELEAWGPEAGA